MTVTAIKGNLFGMRPPVRITGWAPGGPTTITAHYFGVDIVLHTIEDLYRVWRQVQANDIDSKGYSDIMYNLGLSPFSSDVYLLRGLENRNAANGSTQSNQASISVLVPLGPAAKVLEIPEARNNIFYGAVKADLLIKQEFGKNLSWVGHQFWKPTACPGTWMMGQLAGIDHAVEPPITPIQFVPNPDYSKRPWLSVGSTDQTAATTAGEEYIGDGYVSFLQRVLNGAAGQNIAVDGIFGGGEGNAHTNTTESAVRNVQAYFGYLADGIVWTETWGLIHWIATMNSIS